MNTTLDILKLKQEAIEQIISHNLDRLISKDDEFALLYLTFENNVIKAHWQWKQTKFDKILFIKRKVIEEDMFITLHNLKYIKIGEINDR